VLFTFPSRYWFTIGHARVLRLGGWSPHVQTGFHVSRLTQGRSRALPVRGCHPLWRTFPDASGSLSIATGLVRVRSPLLTESRLMSFPPGTEMFQFPGFASNPYVFRIRYLLVKPVIEGQKLALLTSDNRPRRWVSPFGNPRIKACSQLPTAYRSVPRPSSPAHA
jgi:hypothetical protein